MGQTQCQTLCTWQQMIGTSFFLNSTLNNYFLQINLDNLGGQGSTLSVQCAVRGVRCVFVGSARVSNQFAGLSLLSDEPIIR